MRSNLFVYHKREIEEVQARYRAKKTTAQGISYSAAEYPAND